MIWYGREIHCMMHKHYRVGAQSWNIELIGYRILLLLGHEICSLNKRKRKRENRWNCHVIPLSQMTIAPPTSPHPIH